MSFRKFCIIAGLISASFSVFITVASLITQNPLYMYGVIGEVTIWLVLPGIASWRYKFISGLAVGAILGLLDAVLSLVEDNSVGPLLPGFDGFSMGSWLLASTAVLATCIGLAMISSGFAAIARKMAAA